MNVASSWKSVTRKQLQQVEPPRPAAARRLERTSHELVGDIYNNCQEKARQADYEWQGLRNFAIGGVVVGGGLSALLAANGATGWAAAAGCVGAGVGLVTGYLGLNQRSEREAWSRFATDLQTWGDQAAANLSRPGSEPGTVENHAFYEAGAFKNVYDVRRDGVVVARHAELENGMKFHEDLAANRVTVESAQGRQEFPKATLELPASPEDFSYYASHNRNPVLQLKTWNAQEQPVVQTVAANGRSDVTFGGRDSMQVFPKTLLAYRATEGLELPDGTVRFEYEKDRHHSYGSPREYEVVYARPPLTASDFQADAPVFADPTVTRKFEHGSSVFRSHPQDPLAPLTLTSEAREQALLTNHIPLPAVGAELVHTVATGQVDLVKDGQIRHTREGRLDVLQGKLVEKKVTQDMRAYPQIHLEGTGFRVAVDTNDNITGYSGPSRLIEGRLVELGSGEKASQIEIPIPRRNWT